MLQTVPLVIRIAESLPSHTQIGSILFVLELEAFLAEHGADDNCIARLPELPEELPSLPLKHELGPSPQKSSPAAEIYQDRVGTWPPDNSPLAAPRRREPWIPRVKLTAIAQQRLNELPRVCTVSANPCCPFSWRFSEIAAMTDFADPLCRCCGATRQLTISLLEVENRLQSTEVIHVCYILYIYI